MTLSGKDKLFERHRAFKLFCAKKNPDKIGNVIKLRNIEKSQIEKYGIFLLKSVDNSHDLCGRFYQILRSGR